MSGVGGVPFPGVPQLAPPASPTACYRELQLHLLREYGRDLTDMRNAIEKTAGSDPQKLAQLGGKLKLLVTALRILEAHHPEASAEEYNALVHMGERVKSAVELYRTQKATRAASRATAATAPRTTVQPLSQQLLGLPAQLPGGAAMGCPEPSWEMPLDYITTLIAEERQRLPSVPELAALQAAGAPPARHAVSAPEAVQREGAAGLGGGGDGSRVNPFMQQALAIAQGLPYGPSPVPSSSLNLPPLPASHSQPLGYRGAVSLDLSPGGGFGCAANRSWAGPATQHSGGAADPALAFSSAFYSAGPGWVASAGSSQPRAMDFQPSVGASSHKRPAAAMSAEGEGPADSNSVAANSQGSSGCEGGQRGGRAKYRSVSFDQPSRLRPLRSCPEAEFAFWGGGSELSSGARIGSCGLPTAEQRRSISLGAVFGSGPSAAVGAAVACAPPSAAADAGAGAGASVSPFVQLAVAQTQQQGGGTQPLPLPGLQGAEPNPLGALQLSLGPAPTLTPPQPCGGPLPVVTSPPSHEEPSEALLLQRQRQWQQLLALRQQQQQHSAEISAHQAAAAAAANPFAAAAWPETPSLPAQLPGDNLLASGLSPAQMILQGLPPEAGALPAAAGRAGAASPCPPGGEAPRRSKQGSVPSMPSQSSPASLTSHGSGTSRCSNGVSAGAGAPPAQASGTQPPPLQSELSAGAGLAAATGRLQLGVEAVVKEEQGVPALSQQEKQGWEQLFAEAVGTQPPAGGSAPAAMEISLPPPRGQQVAGSSANAGMASGLPLSRSTFDARAQELQPACTAGGAAPAAPGGGGGAAAAATGGLQIAGTSPTSDAMAFIGSPLDSGCGLLAQLDLGEELGPAACTLPLSPSLPSVFAGGGPGGGAAGAAAAAGPPAAAGRPPGMLQAPSLPLNMLDTTRFDSLLFELGPDFLPDFDAAAGL